MFDLYYHTQEKRYNNVVLKKPIICKKNNAWLGDACYFWVDRNDAEYWGNTAKKRTGKFDVYSAQIKSDNILDTVFDSAQYFFWVKQIEKVAINIIKKTGYKPTLKEINDFLKEKGIWSKFDGILFQDISNHPIHFLVSNFQYKKRIQIAVYNNDIIINFAHLYEGECVYSNQTG